MRAQLGIKDDILRGLGMCLQQAKRARVRTRALLANLRSNNDCGLSAPLFKEKENRMEERIIKENTEDKIGIPAAEVTDTPSFLVLELSNGVTSMSTGTKPLDSLEGTMPLVRKSSTFSFRIYSRREEPMTSIL